MRFVSPQEKPRCPFPTPLPPVRALIRSRIVETGVASLALAVAKDGEVIWEEGFGWASREGRAASAPTCSSSRILQRTGRAGRPSVRRQPRPEPSPFRPTSNLLNSWEGRVHTCNDDLVLTLEFQTDGHIHARLGDQLKTLVNEPRFENGVLTGKLADNIGTQDANKHPYHLHLNLRGEILNGVLTTLPGNRPGNALSHWAELTKCKEKILKNCLCGRP